VFRAYGGEQAIDIARKELPDLIVLDLVMPGVSGFDVIDALKEHPETARIPVLVVTASPLTEAEREKLRMYGLTVMEKFEFDGERFAKEVRRAMSYRRAVA
jgi:CheY-like chemotaxis protein